METYSRVAVVVLGFLLATAAGTPVVRGFFRLALRYGGIYFVYGGVGGGCGQPEK